MMTAFVARSPPLVRKFVAQFVAALVIFHRGCALDSWCVAHTLLGGGRVGGRKRSGGVGGGKGGGVGGGGRDVILEALHKRDRSLP